MLPLRDDEILRWNASLIAIGNPQGRLALTTDTSQHLLSEPLLQHAVRFFQEPRSLAELIKAISPPFDPQTIRFGVERLCATDILVRTALHGQSRNITGFWDSVSQSGDFHPVAVQSLIPRVGDSVAGQLNASGITVRDDADFVVLLTDDYLRPEAMRARRQFAIVLPAKPVGSELWIGPLLSDQGPLCWDCLAYWLSLRRWPEWMMSGIGNLSRPASAAAFLPSTLAAAGGLIATTAGIIASGKRDIAAAHRLWIFDFKTFTAFDHPVLPRDNCAFCRSARDEMDVDQKIAILAGQRTGLLANTRASQHRTGPLFLVNSAVLAPLPLPGARELFTPLSADGKAGTREEAFHRCVWEAVERFSSVYVGDEPSLNRELGEANCVSPNDVMGYSPRQYAERETWNALALERDRVPEPISTGTPMRWVKARSLMNDEDMLFPAGLVYLGYPFDREPEYACAVDTNGCAAAKTLPEATLHALLEVIERDALAIWWYNRLQRPGFDLAASEDPEIQAYRELFTANERSLELLDLTHDLEIPVYAGISADSSGRNIYIGCAANLCGLHAAKSALAELTQFWYWDSLSKPANARKQRLEASDLRTHPHLAPIARTSELGFQKYSPEEGLETCLGRLKSKGIRAYAVDITRPELGLPAVRVLAPGMRHCARRLAPGRLYDVPVSMGWLAQAHREEELSPIACVL